MRRWALVSCTLVLAVPVVAAAGHQPPADAGEMPLVFAYAKTGPDAGVRTGIVVTAGAGPAVQRVAYGTSEGIFHLQTLDRGSPVGPGGSDSEPGMDLDEGPVNDTATFGSDPGTIDPVDTSTEDRLGHVLVLHNDNGGVHLAQVDAVTGELAASGQAVDQSLGCSANSTPALTPPDHAGDRFVFFTMTGGACRRAGLLRARVTRAATREARVEPAELIPIGDLNPNAAPAVAYLEDGDGVVRPFVAVAAAGRVSLFPATAALDGAAPAISVALPAGETPQTPLVALTGSGLPPGAPGSGIAKTPALYVTTALGSGEARVHQLVQRGREQALTVARSSAPLAGTPAPAMATGEVAEDSGARPGGRLVVTTSAAAHIVDTAGLGVVGSVAAQPGFGRTTARVSGSYAYLLRDNGEPIVVHTGSAQRVPKADLVPNSGQVAGNAYGAPAVSRGFVLWGGAGGAFAYRNRDVTAPFVALAEPGDRAVLAGSVTFAAVAGDSRGVKHVDFRVIGASGNPRVVARDTEPDDGSPFLAAGARYSGTVNAGSLASGTYTVDVVVTDAAGNTAVSGRRAVRVAGGSQRAGRCTNQLLGGAFGDQLTGTGAGDRILGRAGDDVLRGLAGDDCLLGGAGNDRLVGGPGNDRLAGGPGADRIAAGPGRDHVDAVDGVRDRVNCGPGIDRVRADPRDRLRSCERVQRVRGRAGP
jgi:hypothetical protein